MKAGPALKPILSICHEGSPALSHFSHHNVPSFQGGCSTYRPNAHGYFCAVLLLLPRLVVSSSWCRSEGHLALQRLLCFLNRHVWPASNHRVSLSGMFSLPVIFVSLSGTPGPLLVICPPTIPKSSNNHLSCPYGAERRQVRSSNDVRERDELAEGSFLTQLQYGYLVEDHGEGMAALMADCCAVTSNCRPSFTQADVIWSLRWPFQVLQFWLHTGAVCTQMCCCPSCSLRDPKTERKLCASSETRYDSPVILRSQGPGHCALVELALHMHEAHCHVRPSKPMPRRRGMHGCKLV
eukprot:scaffold63098_cov24-Tisochrysis_lutea.AAC.1